jgi:hypothetical protein
MSDRTYTLVLKGSDLALLHEALGRQAKSDAETMASIRRTKRCTSKDANDRYPAYRVADHKTKRCEELRRALIDLSMPRSEAAPE